MKKLNPKDFANNYEYELAKKKVKKNALNDRSKRLQRTCDNCDTNTPHDTEVFYYEALTKL